MEAFLRYGRSHLKVDLGADNEVQQLNLNPLPPLASPTTALTDSLQSPINSTALDKLARGRESACIVICDVTRPVPNETLLTALLGCLHDSGIPEDKVTILVATGLHRPNEGAELEEMIGARIAQKYRVVNHVARDKQSQRSLGEIGFTSEGNSAHVALNQHYLNSDLKITTGLIEPHFMAGYSGGRKLVCPGIASAETILQFHAPPMIAHPRARTGNLNENPVHRMSRAVAKRAGVDFICNVTLSEERRITGIFSGELDAAHSAGVQHVDKQTKVPCEPADIVITSGAGYPLDTTFYQSIKAMVGALPAVKPNGMIIVAASMSEGIGGREFAEMCQTLTTVEEFNDRLFAAPQVIIDQWQLQEMMLALQKAEIMVVTDGVPAEFLQNCMLKPMPSVEMALRAARATHGSNAKITVIPEGPYVTPVPSQPNA